MERKLNNMLWWFWMGRIFTPKETVYIFLLCFRLKHLSLLIFNFWMEKEWVSSGMNRCVYLILCSCGRLYKGVLRALWSVIVLYNVYQFLQLFIMFLASANYHKPKLGCIFWTYYSYLSQEKKIRRHICFSFT